MVGRRESGVGSKQGGRWLRVRTRLQFKLGRAVGRRWPERPTVSEALKTKYIAAYVSQSHMYHNHDRHMPVYHRF